MTHFSGPTKHNFYMPDIFKEYLDFANETAYQAGRLTLDYFGSDLEADYKGDDTPVTIADRKAESLIRRRIESKYPDHAILGEEYGRKDSQNTTFRWIIDPIDGTKSFIRGVPLYGVLIGLEVEGVIEVGVVYFPALDEIIYAATGLGCYCNGRRAFVSGQKALDRSFVSFTDIASFEQYGRAEEWDRIKAATYYRVGWSDAYGHALVATGRLELMLDPIVNPWDCGPFPVLLREAGGYFGTWDGKETIYGDEAMSTTRILLPEVLKLINE